MKTIKNLRNVQEQASPMIKPPKNEFGKKEDAFAHAKQHGGKVMKKTFTHPTSGMQTVSYVVREDVEQIDELKRKTLASYVSKAAGSYGRDKQLIGRTSPDGTMKNAEPELKRAVKNRLTGINRAAERLAKEETEIDEASKKPNATTRHLRQYPVSDKDVAKPIAYYSLVHKATNKVLSTHKDLESAKDEHRGMDQGERAHYRIATSTKAPKSFSMKEDAEGVAEGYTGRETKDGTWHVFKNGKAVAVAGPYKSREEAAAWIKKQKQGVAEGSNTDLRKKIYKHEELALQANKAGDDAKSKMHQQKIQLLKQKMSQGVAEAAFKDPSPMMKDSIKQDKIRSLKNLIAVAKVKGVHHKVKELESELKKLKETTEVTEAGAFSYGAKPPRKGSVAYNALMKRKEQDKKRVKEIEAIGTKNHHVGVARVVTKEDIEHVTEAKDADQYSYIDQTKGPVIKGKSGTYVGYTHSASKGKGANILKHNKTKKYYAAGGSSTAFTQKTTLHDTPQAAAKAYHKGKLAEQDEKETQEYDYEGDMARSDLRSIIFNAQEVHDMLEANTNLPEWVQAKITIIEDYMSSVRDYMKAENEKL